MRDAFSFERCMRKKAERAAKGPTTTDQDYRDYVAAMSGEQAQRDAGRAFHVVPGGEDPAAGTSDDAVYATYLAELDGSAARRRSEQNARQERHDREEEVIRHASQVGGGLSRLHEALRDRLEGFGRPGEGGT